MRFCNHGHPVVGSAGAVFVFLFVAVVGEFDAEYDDTGDGGDGVGDDEGPVVDHNSLNHKENASESEQEECGHGYSVGVTGADSVYGLREIAADHTDIGCVAYDVDEQWIHIAERFLEVCFCQFNAAGRLKVRSTMCNHVLSDLDGVQGRSFFYLVAYKPEGYSSTGREIGAQTSYIDGI